MKRFIIASLMLFSVGSWAAAPSSFDFKAHENQVSGAALNEWRELMVTVGLNANGNFEMSVFKVVDETKSPQLMSTLPIYLPVTLVRFDAEDVLVVETSNEWLYYDLADPKSPRVFGTVGKAGRVQFSYFDEKNNWMLFVHPERKILEVADTLGTEIKFSTLLPSKPLVVALSESKRYALVGMENGTVRVFDYSEIQESILNP